MLELHKRNLLKGMKTCKLDFCKFCVYGKQPRVSFKTGSYTSQGVLDYVHSHVWRPVSVSSHRGAHYFVNFIDDYFRKVYIYFLQWNSKVYVYLKSGKCKLKIKLIEK